MCAVRVGKVVPKTVAGLVPFGANPDSPSDVIVASWIKGGERVRLKLLFVTQSKQANTTVHQPGMVSPTPRRMAVGGSGSSTAHSVLVCPSPQIILKVHFW